MRFLGAGFGFEAALFGEKADAAGGLAFEVAPGVAADAAGHDDLGFAVGEEREDALVAGEIEVEGTEVVAEARAALAGEGEDGEVGGGVDVELGGDGARKLFEGEAGGFFEGAGEGLSRLMAGMVWRTARLPGRR